MRKPHELMSQNYCGPSKVISLDQIPNKDNFRFIGIDRDGGQHYCIVRKDDDGTYYMASNTVTFQNLMGWLPDMTEHGEATANYIEKKYPDVI